MTSRKLILHVDGSNVYVPKTTRQGIGWAVIACHDDELHEIHGGYEHHRNGPLTGCHEQIAFIEGVNYAYAKGFDFRDMTILCDDMLLGYAQTSLHPDNFSVLRADAVRARLAHVTSLLYDTQTVQRVLDAIEQASIHKLKGHNLDVYQERADYLAKAGARKVCGLSGETPLSYEAWLVEGIHTFDHKDMKATVWHAPFVKP